MKSELDVKNVQITGKIMFCEILALNKGRKIFKITEQSYLFLVILIMAGRRLKYQDSGKTTQ